MLKIFLGQASKLICLLLKLAQKYDVKLPIIEEVNKVLFDGVKAKDAIGNLMLRDKKLEHPDVEWS